MAKIKRGNGIQDIRGGVKNHVYSDWRGRGYLRSKSISSSNPMSNHQADSRSIWGWLAKVWKSQLTQAQRDSWQAYAQRFPKPGKGAVSSGPIIKPHGRVLSGYNAFVRNNSLALDAGVLASPDFIPSIDYLVGRTVKFDGVDERIDVPNFGQSATGALRGWFYFDSLTAPEGLFSHYRTRAPLVPRPRLQFYVSDIGGGDYRLYYYRTTNDGTVARVWCYGSTSIVPGRYYFIVFQQTGVGEEIWLNGVRETLTYVAGTTPFTLWTSGLQGTFLRQVLMCLVAAGDVLNYFSQARPDEVVFYDDFRTPAEIVFDYDLGRGRYKYPEGNMVCGYHLDEGESTTLSDFSCNDYHGALINTEPGDWIDGHVPVPLDLPEAPTSLACFWNGPGQKIDITWGDPTKAVENSLVRVWIRTYGPGAHRQQVVSVSLCTENVGITHVRAAAGNSVPVASLPGSYQVQVDCVDPRGQLSPPSNICQVIVP